MPKLHVLDELQRLEAILAAAGMKLPDVVAIIVLVKDLARARR